jgi:ribosomal protein S18 acetylase RimI-like enzyme
LPSDTLTPICIDLVTPETLEAFDRALRHLSEVLGDPHRAGMDELRVALFGGYPSAVGLLARSGDEAMGGALFSPVMSTSLGVAGVYVSDLWVAEAARGAGLGQSLLAAVARHADRLWQARFIKLISYGDNHGALGFYDRLGFEAKDRETVLALTGAAFKRLKDKG